MNKNKLIIISGASRGIGKSFLDKYKKQNKFNTIIGLNRTGSSGYKIDLTNKNETKKFIEKINVNEVSRIIYIHAIGIDKFEPEGKPQKDSNNNGIDDEIYQSNVTTFLNLAKPLIKKISKENIQTTICNIGSISDIYNVPYWQSFTKSKNIVRQFSKSIKEQNINSVILNTSSTLDEKLNTFGRINANIDYWQTSKELVNKSFELLDKSYLLKTKYLEADFIKENPDFREDYFTNLQKLYKHWQKELGYEGKTIPEGIRI